MLIPILLSVAASFPGAGGIPLAVRVVQDNPPIEVWLSKRENVGIGESVRVYVRTGSDGHVVVLHADPSGRVRALYPIDPSSDDFIRGGRAYEVRDRQGREAFVAGQVSGVGMLYVAYSLDPFLYSQMTLDGHWDNRALGIIDVTVATGANVDVHRFSDTDVLPLPVASHSLSA